MPLVRQNYPWQVTTIGGNSMVIFPAFMHEAWSKHAELVLTPHFQDQHTAPHFLNSIYFFYANVQLGIRILYARSQACIACHLLSPLIKRWAMGNLIVHALAYTETNR
jgi:hypothetical protein